MTIADDDLKTIIEKVLMDERERIYFDWVNMEEIVTPSLKIKRSWHMKKPVAIMNLEDWEQYRDSVKEILQAFFYACKRLELMEQNQQKPAMTFDEYIKKEVMAYDSEEFERVRDEFESQCMMPDIDEIER